MGNIAYLNSKFIKFNQAKIHIEDRGLQFGDNDGLGHWLHAARRGHGEADHGVHRRHGHLRVHVHHPTGVAEARLPHFHRQADGERHLQSRRSGAANGCGVQA